MQPTQTKFTALIVRLVLIVILLAALTGSVYAAAGDLDTTFGSPNGFVTTDISATDEAFAVAVQSDGKIIAAGYSSHGGITARDFTLVRYSAAGVPDIGFGLGGKVVTPIAVGNLNDIINAIALQTDGDIVATGPVNISGGKSVFGVARYMSTTGALDPGFGVGGIVTTSLSANNDIPTAIAIQSNGQIVVGGSADGNFAVVRYNPNGSLDTSFNGTGMATTDFGGTDIANALVIQPADGKIILGGNTNVGVTGNNFALARYTSTGALDTTFNGTGTVVTNFVLHSNEFIEGLALQPDGNIVAVGRTNSGVSDFALARYLPNGALDGTFGGTGFFATSIGADADEAHAVTVLPTGKILVVGFSNQGASRLNDFALVRYQNDGTLDAAFGAGGIVTTTLTATSDDLAYAMAIQPDHKIVVAGSSNAGVAPDFAVARYLTTNVPPTITSFAKSGLEDNNLAFTAADFTSHFSDADNDLLAKIKVTSLPANGVLKLNNVAVALNQEVTVIDLGNLTFTPDLNFNGATSFNWNASDGIAYAAAEATVSISVSPVNDPPSFTKGPDINAIVATLQTFPAWATNISPGPIDEASQLVSFTVTNDNNLLFDVQPAVASNGTLTFQLVPSFNGSALVTLVAHDNGGTANGGVDSSAPQTFMITTTVHRQFLPLILR